MLPPSPMKIRAGWRLKTRNPQVPPNTAIRISIGVDGPSAPSATAMAALAIATTPPASPSRPSMKFIPTVTSEIHRIVRTHLDVSDVKALAG